MREIIIYFFFIWTWFLFSSWKSRLVIHIRVWTLSMEEFILKNSLLEFMWGSCHLSLHSLWSRTVDHDFQSFCFLSACEIWSLFSIYAIIEHLSQWFMNVFFLCAVFCFSLSPGIFWRCLEWKFHRFNSTLGYSSQMHFVLWLWISRFS